MSDSAYMYDEDEGESSTVAERDAGPGLRSAADTLAQFALIEALGPAGVRRLGRSGIAVVVTCPDASWVEPVRAAAGREWSGVYARTGGSKFMKPGEAENTSVRNQLAGGGRVLGVSQDPSRHLPSALTVAADLTVTIGAPSGKLIAKVIRAASGRSPGRLPEGVAATLSYDEICASIRLGSPPSASVRRLRTATESKASADPLVAEAPAFETLAGYSDAHDWGMALIASVSAWRRKEIPLSAVTSRCVLLASEPGLGKTSMCRSLAKSAGMKLVSTSVAAWFTGGPGYLDSVLKQADAVFSAAAANSPCVLLLDELDSLPSREGLSTDRGSWWSPVITGIMLACDRLIADEHALVAIVGATNHPERIDPALLRPGRLDRIIHLRRPDAEALVGIVRTHLGRDLAGEDIGVVGELGAGATGAAAASWVARARAKAALERRPMALADLTSAIAPPDPRSATTLRRAAIHEAGHAAAIELLSVGTVSTVSIVTSNSEGGHVVHDRRPGGDLPVRATVEAAVVSLLAGRAAEVVLLGEPSSGSGGDDQSDLARATRLVADLNGALGMGGYLTYRGAGAKLLEQLRFDPHFGRLVENDLQRLALEAEAFVSNHREAIERVTAELLARRVIGGERLRALLAEGSARAAGEQGAGS